MEPTPVAELDKATAELKKNKARWAVLDLQARIGLLKETMACTLRHAELQVVEACNEKGIAFDSPQAAEEWLGGPMTVMRNLRLLVESLEQIQTQGRPQLKPNAIREFAPDQLAVEVFPNTTLDKMMFAKFRAEVVMMPGESREQILDEMAWAYRGERDEDGKVALVLGAGNVASIGPMDVLYKLFVENQVCLLKMNPVNEYLGPHIIKQFKPLVDFGALRVVYGGATEGAHLVHHDDVEEVHITGSDFVHDIIVWGKPGEAQDKNRSEGTPVIDKRITSELGCVTPIIVVPGEWTPREMAFQAANVATMVANNASFNCNAAKLLLTWSDWRQRAEFLARVEETLQTIPRREAYYRGSDAKYDSFIEAHPDARQLGERTKTALPWTTIFGVDCQDPDDIVFHKEAWCAIIAESPLSANTPGEFLTRAVAFANEKVWGTLSCAVICSEHTQERLGETWKQALRDLRYGSIGVNHWAAVSYGLCLTTWGAYPGHTLKDIRSGIGVVHNTFMFKAPQKSIVYGPFTAFPKPPWFSTHKNAHNVAKRLVALEADPSLLKFGGVAFSAIRG